MDKRVVFAVAGSGKTRLIIETLNETERFLVITYTNRNLQNLRSRILQRFGHIPNNIKLFSYYTFLYSFCTKPIITSNLGRGGIVFNRTAPMYAKKSSDDYYFIGNKFYSNRLAKYLIQKNLVSEILARVEKYFDYFLIDEVQDIAGNDFNFLSELSALHLPMLLVGDFYQHTFDTSRDGSVNKTLHSDLNSYKGKFSAMGLNVDTESLHKSHRCSPTVCDYIREKINIPIESHRVDGVNLEAIDDKTRADQILTNDDIVKLFYKEHYKFDCVSANWGEVKGEDSYHDVCVVLNPTTYTLFLKDSLHVMAPSTKNKFYVACTRAKKNLYFLPQKLCGKYRLND